MCAFFLVVFLFISRSQKLIYGLKVNIKILVRQIIGPAAASSVAPVPTPVQATARKQTRNHRHGYNRKVAARK